MATEIDIIAQITGPTGGIMAMIFGIGCASGWGFSQMFFVRGIRQQLKTERERFEGRIEQLEKRCAELEAKLLAAKDATIDMLKST